MAASRPALLTILAALGLVLGAFGILYSVASSTPLLSSRDDYMAAVRESAEKQLPQKPPSKLGTKDELTQMVEKQADVIYSRRGVALPLAAMNVILSFLLFAGCARALRGMPWGWSAWNLAAMVSIPYTLLDCTFALVQARDLQVAFASVTGPMSELAHQWTGVQAMLAMLKSTVELMYFAICVLYLRRASVRRLFMPPKTS